MAIQTKKRDSFFKIAKIVDEYTVVINGGSNHGIVKGDLFQIYDPGSDVFDPDTGENLGKLEYIKAAITAKQVYPKMTACVSQDVMSSLISSISQSIIGRPAELSVNSEEISGGYDETICVGDFVRKVASSSESDQESQAVD